MSPKVHNLRQPKAQIASDLAQSTGPELRAPLQDVAEASGQPRADGPFSLNHIMRQKVPKQKHMQAEDSMANVIVLDDIFEHDVDPIPEDIAIKARRSTRKPPSGLSFEKKSKSVV